ncbi:MAG: GtrA family protein [Methylobacter sp.]|uniref:GtrA family protein n=1 Tax=Methylobacter sp. TaxID=2051955 RepID=UPI0025F738E5|nr:GtrA family protein [Methylobacter sp.]MCK9620490.1 GtrA family protein [Methylobacter sp.]
MKLAVTYTAFAIIATIANIAAQDITVHIYIGMYSIILSVIAGTAVGLVIKYILDKRYIFRFQTRNISHNNKVFVLYALMGIVTTMIFWFFEFGFNHLFQTKEMRYFGGVIGLAIGYIVKYQLDKRFVFRSPKEKITS